MSSNLIEPIFFLGVASLIEHAHKKLKMNLFYNNIFYNKCN
ncbi:MAG TPA: hypothetical protein O0X14_01380 [Methanocorpusculum sp.]|nr:hypothetical protein [Methanocorpusculum sp.]